MREVELKAVVDDLQHRRKIVEKAGAKLTYEGRLRDQRYDDQAHQLSKRDEVLRVRRYESRAGVKTHLDWKGPTETDGSYKIREEISTLIDDFDSLARILDRLGLILVREIDREIAQYQLGAATLRFEIYPRMDTLVEVEGSADAIEDAIQTLGIARGQFSADRLAQFVERFENRTGVQAAISDRELSGDYSLREFESQ